MADEDNWYQQQDRDDDLYRPEEDHHEQGKKPGMSAGMKFLLVIIGLSTTLMLACCCGIGIFAWQASPKVDDDPAIVAETTKQLLTIEIPDTFSPNQSIRMNLVMIEMLGSFYEYQDDSGFLIIGGMRGQMIANQEEFIQEIQNGFNTESSEDGEFVIEESETREFEISGQVIPFEFAKGAMKGSAEDSEKKFRQVSAIIQTNDGAVLFLLQIEEESWKEEEIKKMIESIELEPIN